nr:DUF1654 domain-containing protein [uncultured Halomonas sp.]
MAELEQSSATQSSRINFGQRVHRAVDAPRARMAQHIILDRQPDESSEDWERMLEEIDAYGHATITRYSKDNAGLRWNLAETPA